MPDPTETLHLVLALSVDSSALVESEEPRGGMSTVITFSCEIDGVRCDGEISLRLLVSD